MQDKEELKKQVLMLAIILVVVIIFAIILNANKTNNIYTTNKKQDGVTTNNSTVETQDEIMNNLKGLIESSDNKEDEQKEQTIKDTISTGVSEEIQVNSSQTVKYEETWYGDN